VAEPFPGFAALKDKLMRNRNSSVVFDTKSATRHIETAYQTMADIARRHQPPCSFSAERIFEFREAGDPSSSV
jgi:hypothetical protein